MTCDEPISLLRAKLVTVCIPVAGRSAACTGSSAAPAAGAPAPPAGPGSTGTAAPRTRGTARTSARSARPATLRLFDPWPLVYKFHLTLNEPKKYGHKKWSKSYRVTRHLESQVLLHSV